MRYMACDNTVVSRCGGDYGLEGLDVAVTETAGEIYAKDIYRNSACYWELDPSVEVGSED